MIEIRTACQTARKVVPSLFTRESEFQKRVFLVSPEKTLKATPSVHGVILQGVMSLNLPAPKGKHGGPQQIDVKTELDGLEFTSKVNIDLTKLAQGSKSEMIQALFLVCLMEIGIFNNPVKRAAFQVLTNWPE